MGGSDSNCADASSDVALYDTTNSSYGSAPEIPPTTDGQLSTVAGLYGCLYSGPTQISLAGNQMTVISPDTPESTVNGTTYDTNNNSSTNTNSCPNNGTATLPSNGVVYVENASAPQPWANPFDDPIANSVTNLTESGTLSSGKSVTLTATVSSDSSQLNSGATVSFGQTTKNGYGNGTSTSTINGCSSQSLSTPTAVVPATTPASYTATATCQFTYSSSNTGAFSATYSGGTYASTSSANLGETYTLTPSFTYGPDAQTSAGGCTSCYYGETSSPDAEGDAFVNGSLSGELTIGTANDVVVDGNITYADCNWTTGQSGEAGSFCPYNNTGANDTLGLIANNYVEVNQPILASTSNSQNPTLLPSCSTPAAICNPSPGTNGLTIDAAILALTESFVVNNYGDGSTQGLLNDYGSIQQYARGPVGTFNETCSGFGNTNCTYAMASGYEKHYTWDPLLDYLSPPSYLAPSTAAWTLESVSNNAGTQATADNVCPPLEPPYGYTQWITAYCSQTIGGLPNYPSATVPTPPTGVTATANADGTVNVTWADPVSSNGSSISNYTVTSNPACSTCGGTSVSGSSATSATITGLSGDQTYTFTVTATNASGASSPSNASNWVQVPGVPNAPTLASAVANANGSVSVNWTDPSNNGSAITGYTVNPSPSCSTCSGTSVSGAAATATTITGLTGGSSYTFTVTATNDVGTSTSSASSNSVTIPSVPGTPTGVTATPGNTQATVTWTAPSNGGSAITAYVITPYLNGTTAQTAQTFTSTNTTQAVTGLTNGNAYTFKVAAINAVGTGNQSSSSNSVTPAHVPGAPTIGTATAGNASATVTWTAPASNGGSAISGYTVTPYIGGVAQTTQTFNSAATTETVTGLTNGTAYTFTVVAINAVGPSAQSGYSNSVTPVTVPGAPTIGTATGGNASAVVTWTDPSSNGGATITSYVVTPYIGGAAQTAQSFSSSATSGTVTGLTNGTTYTFTVAAINSAGESAQSAASNSVTPVTTPGAPTIGTATGGNASATVTWTAPASNGGATITSYVVTPYTSVGNVAQTAQTFNSAATTETVSGLTNGTAYYFKVAAINSVGTGNQSGSSNSVTPMTVPGAPTMGSVTSGNTTVTVNWTAPASNGGSPITSYVVTPYIGGLAQIAQSFSSSATSGMVTGLTNGTSYTFTVAAINSVGESNQSGSSSSVIPATTPGAPTIGTATSGNASASLTWTAPASNGGSAITGYVVTPYLNGTTAQTAQTFNSAAATETVTGLSNSPYTFKVAAINIVGTGPQSAASNSVTPVTVAGAPAIGTATAGNAQATLSWTAPGATGGSPVTGYAVTPYIGGVAQTVQTFNTTATTEVVTGLTNGTAYTFTVAAINAQGTGAQSGASNSVTPATTPGAPTITAATSGNSSVSLTWTTPASNGAAITGYVVTPYIGTAAQTATTFNIPATTETVGGLTNGTAYTFTVAAINSVGTGAAFGPLQLGDPGHRARCAHHWHGHRRQRLGHTDLDGPGLHRRGAHHRLRGDPVHRRHGPDGPDLQLAGPHRGGDRADQRDRLYVQGGRHQQCGHRRSVRLLQLGHPADGARCAHHHCRHQRQRLGQPVLDGPGLQWRRHHHRLCGHPVHRGRSPGGPDLQLAGPQRDGHRAGQRHRLYLHRGRHQQPGHRHGLGRLQPGDPGHRGRRTHHRDSHPGQRLGQPDLDGAGHHWWGAHHRLRGHPLHRGHGPGGPDLQLARHHRDGGQPDQREHLHLQGGRHQQRRHRGPVGRLQLGHPGHHTQCAHHRDGHRRYRLGHRDLDGAGLQRGQPHHAVRGHPVHRRCGPDAPDLQLHGHH